MLKVSGTFPIACTHCPSISFHYYLAGTQCYHRFDGNAHTLFQQSAISSFSIIGYLRIFMHIFSNAMTYKFSYHTIGISLAMLLDSKTYITQTLSMNGILYT